MKHFTLAAVSAAALLAVPGAFADQITGVNMNVTAQIVGACSNLQAADLIFGQHPAVAGTFDTTANVTVTCNSGAAYTVELDYGVNEASGGTGTQRQVSNETTNEFMDYDIYQPTASGAGAKAAAWGTLTNNAAYPGTGTGSAQTLVATGTLHVNQNQSIGTYTDVVIVTLNF